MTTVELDTLAVAFEEWATRGHGPLGIEPLDVHKDPHFDVPVYTRWETHVAFLAFVEGVKTSLAALARSEHPETVH